MIDVGFLKKASSEILEINNTIKETIASVSATKQE